MSPANGHANDPANGSTSTVQQFAVSASDTNIPTILTLNAAKTRELIANVEVPFHPSVIEWRVTNTGKGGSSRGHMPYADQRAYTDLLNALFTPAGWTRRPWQWPSNGNDASGHGASLVREIERMEQALGKRMHRGLLKIIPRVWNPKDIQDQALQQKVLEHMQTVERGFRRLDAALDRVGPESLTQILRSLSCSPSTGWTTFQALCEIVLALEGDAPRNYEETIDDRQERLQEVL